MNHTQIACILRSAATVINPLLARSSASAAEGDLEMLQQIEVTGGNLACSDYDGHRATLLHQMATPKCVNGC